MADMRLHMRTSPLKILQWNCRSINSNSHYLTQHLDKVASQIICLQSLNINKFKLPHLAGYYYPPIIEFQTKSTDKVQTATYILLGIAHEILPPPFKFNPDHPIYCNVLQIKPSQHNRNIKLINSYALKSINSSGLDWLNELSGDRWIILGDWNIHHPLWYTKINTHNIAQRQADTIIKSNCIILNNGQLTRIPDRPNQNPSAVDIFLISPSLLAEAHWAVGDDPLGSDHLPILIKITPVAPPLLETSLSPKGKFNIDKANWPLYSKLISEGLISLDQSDINIQCTSITNLIIRAAEGSIPRKGTAAPKRPSNPWWTEACAKAVKNKKHFYNKWKNHRTTLDHQNMKETNIECNKVIAEAKLNLLNQQITDEIKYPTDISKAWKIVRKLKNTYNPSPVPLVYKNTKYSSDQDKANLLAEIFAATSSTSALAPHIQANRAAEECKPDYSDPIPPHNPLPINLPFTMQELNSVLNQISFTKSAPGFDEITCPIIKHLPDKGKTLVLKFMNNCFTKGLFPHAWCHGIVTPIPKPNKFRNHLNSFRPITLTSHFSKILEKLVKSRLEYQLDKDNAISIIQAGFRKFRSCADQLYTLSSSI